MYEKVTTNIDLELEIQRVIFSDYLTEKTMVINKISQKEWSNQIKSDQIKDPYNRMFLDQNEKFELCEIQFHSKL